MNLRAAVQAVIPAPVRARLRRGGPILMDQAQWDREYATGYGEALGSLAQLPRNSMIAGYCGMLGRRSVLDIGCGIGVLRRHLAPLGYTDYVGVDLSQTAIEQARREAPASARFEVAAAGDNLMNGNGGGVTGVGAGILNFSDLKLIESTISNNIGVRGGGIANSGSLDVTNSTISGNRASIGGGIEDFSRGVVNITFSTITDNAAGRETGEPRQNRRGGGIMNFGQVNIGNSILAGNRDGRSLSDDLFSPDCFSTGAFAFTSFRGNLVGILNANCDMEDTVWGGTPFDLVGTPEAPLDPRLEPLADNSSLTRTHALRPDSPAIDHGTGATSASFFNCPETDQRGRMRPAGVACDVGSFEFIN